MAAYTQMLAQWLLETRPTLSRDIYLTYLVNRFRATRYGLEAIIIDPTHQHHKPMTEDILQTCAQLEPYAIKLDAIEALIKIRTDVLKRNNDAKWLRSRYLDLQSLNDVVRAQTELWKTTTDQKSGKEYMGF